MRDTGEVTGVCIIIALIGCVSSPYLEDAERTGHESEYLRTREELRDFRERFSRQSNVPIDDGSLDHVNDALDQLDDPLLDDDMRIVLEARNSVEERNGNGAFSKHDWIHDLRTEVRIATNNAATIEPTDRASFKNPNSISETAWCAWYVRGAKRRELTIDPTMHEIAQSFEWH